MVTREIRYLLSTKELLKQNFMRHGAEFSEDHHGSNKTGSCAVITSRSLDKLQTFYQKYFISTTTMVEATNVRSGEI